MRKDFWMRECSCAGPAFEGQSRLGERESWSSILFRGGLRYQRDFKQLRLSNQPAISSWYRKIGPRDPLHFLPRFRFAWPCIASKSPFLPQLYTGERERERERSQVYRAARTAQQDMHSAAPTFSPMARTAVVRLNLFCSLDQLRDQHCASEYNTRADGAAAWVSASRKRAIIRRSGAARSPFRLKCP